MGTLWTHHGEISYVSFDCTTGWHGVFTEVGEEITLQFNCKGNKPWHGARLVRGHDGVWRGFDYRCRSVEMTRLGRMDDSGNWFADLVE